MTEKSKATDKNFNLFLVHIRLKTRILVYVCLLLFLSLAIFGIYQNYQDTLVRQQQQQMLSISKSISRSIQLFFSEIRDQLRTMTYDPSFRKDYTRIDKDHPAVLDVYHDRLEAFINIDRDSVKEVILYDSLGNRLTGFPDNATLDLKQYQELKDVIDKKSPAMGKVLWDKERGAFVLNLYEPVFQSSGLVGVVVASVSLEDIYSRLISPVQIGELGYAMVKDQNGIILMHPVKEQVGMDVLKSRKALFPDLDYKDLETLIAKQLTGKEGTQVYYSYWWYDNKPERAKKLSAFSPVHLGEYFWVVAITMSYEEIDKPVREFLLGIIFIGFIVALMFYVFMSALSKARKSQEELEKETHYLKMLNESSEQLRIQEAELNHAQKLKMVGTLSGGIAHDINNLLTPILGYSELLLEQIEPDSPYKEEIDEIYRASQRGKDLIEQLLMFSRKDDSFTNPNAEYLSIATVTTETLKLLKSILPKGFTLESRMDDNLGFVHANYAQLHQVIFNLCTNAYQATKSGDHWMSVNLDRLTKEDAAAADLPCGMHTHWIRLTVSDKGEGMTPEIQSQIFEPFFTTKSNGEGTGLGLYVSKGIIDRHLGRIKVDSSFGKGTTFTVYLPATDEAPTHSNDDAGQPISNVAGARIVVVDDHEDINRLLSRSLAYYGFDVTTFTSAVDFLKMLKNSNEVYDLLITDYMMPDMLGTELAKKVVRLRKNLPVILMTGYMNESKQAVLKNNAIHGVIAKPLELGNLTTLINQVLSTRDNESL